MNRERVVLSELLEDLENVLDELFGETTIWELTAAALILFAVWPFAVLVGKGAAKLLGRISGVGVAMFGKWIVQLIIVIIGVAWALSVLNIGPGFALVLVIALVTAVVVLAQPFVQNVAAGVVAPYWVGDQIETFKATGTVTNQGLRHTVIETLDRRTVTIPNLEVLSNPIVIYSTAERRRSSLDVWISYETDIENASRILIDAALRVRSVHADPAPYVIPSGFEDGRCHLILKWWHDSDLKTEESTLGYVVTEVKTALDEAGIVIPPPIGVFLSDVPSPRTRTLGA